MVGEHPQSSGAGTESSVRGEPIVERTLGSVGLTNLQRRRARSGAVAGWPVDWDPPHALRLVEASDPIESTVLLIYLDEQGGELTDTSHPTLDAAIARAREEFGVRPEDWRMRPRLGRLRAANLTGEDDTPSP